MAIEQRAFVAPRQGAMERTVRVLSIVGSSCDALRAGPAIGPITISLPLGIISDVAFRKLVFWITERAGVLADVDIQGTRGVIRLRRPEAST